MNTFIGKNEDLALLRSYDKSLRMASAKNIFSLLDLALKKTDNINRFNNCHSRGS